MLGVSATLNLYTQMCPNVIELHEARTEFTKIEDIGIATGEKIKCFRILRGISQKARELQENLLNDTKRFSSEKEHQRAIEALSKNLDAGKQSILDDSKIDKKVLEVYP